MAGTGEKGAAPRSRVSSNNFHVVEQQRRGCQLGLLWRNGLDAVLRPQQLFIEDMHGQQPGIILVADVPDKCPFIIPVGVDHISPQVVEPGDLVLVQAVAPGLDLRQHGLRLVEAVGSGKRREDVALDQVFLGRAAVGEEEAPHADQLVVQLEGEIGVEEAAQVVVGQLRDVHVGILAVFVLLQPQGGVEDLHGLLPPSGQLRVHLGQLGLEVDVHGEQVGHDLGHTLHHHQVVRLFAGLQDAGGVPVGQPAVLRDLDEVWRTVVLCGIHFDALTPDLLRETEALSVSMAEDVIGSFAAAE